MTFRRTVSGLSNLYLFLGVDAVVFVEGGKSINREEVDNGEFTALSQDIRFWQSLFNAYIPNLKIQFRSIGSKEIVKSIAFDIENGQISNIAVAMDRDFDHINGRIINANNVIYTNGYSWENDAWSKITILDAFCSLSGSCKNNIGDVESFINNSMKDFSSCIRGAVRIDAILSQAEDSLFDREKPGRYISKKNNGAPILNKDQLKSSLTEARNRNGKPIHRKSNFKVNEIIDCFGHLLADYSYRLLAYLIDKMKLPKVAKEYATGMVVEKFIQSVTSGLLTDLYQYYNFEFSRITLKAKTQ